MNNAHFDHSNSVLVREDDGRVLLTTIPASSVKIGERREIDYAFRHMAVTVEAVVPYKKAAAIVRFRNYGDRSEVRSIDFEHAAQIPSRRTLVNGTCVEIYHSCDGWSFIVSPDGKYSAPAVETFATPAEAETFVRTQLSLE